MNSNTSSQRRKRKRSSQRRQKQLKLISNNYSDSETDFYQTYGLTQGLTNPLYSLNRNSFVSSETQI
jgi:hypothetical protein